MRIAALALCVLAACKPAEGPAAKAERATAIAPLPDTPPAAGHCAGWHASLEKDWKKTYEVRTCLREMAVRDRPAAVAEARILLGWNLPAESEIRLLATTLQRFPEAAALRDYVDKTGLPRRARNPLYSEDRPPLTVTDHLMDRGLIASFDVETGTFPNAHDQLLGELATLAGPPLSKAVFKEIPPEDSEDDEAPYRLQARLGNKSYDVVAQNHGDWYDVGSVVTLLNRMSTDAGMGTGFFFLPTGDQTAMVLAADRQVVATLVGSSLLVLEQPEQSREDGQAFEAEVQRKLGSGAEVE